MRYRLPRDPRYFQIAVLGSLLLYGLLVLDFEVSPSRALVILATALACQALFSRWAGIPFDPRSPLISALSLTLLLRTGSWLTAALVAAVTIGSKFVLRARGRDGSTKHVFNPTNFGLVVALALSPWLPGGVWVSPGQWGRGLWLVFLLAGLGSLVVRRAERSDVTWAFLGAHVAILFGRAAWLGDPWTIPFHRLESGALLIFAFFMISDPKTTPDSRVGRIVFASLVAAGGAFVSFHLFRPHGLLWALASVALLVPVLDRLFPAERYRWPGHASSPSSSHTVRPQFPPKGAFAMRRILLPVLTLLAPTLAVPALLAPPPAHAFCGFYVARADTALYNDASQVVLVRDGDRTVLTMANDYQGDPTEFAMVIPVPTVLQREQIHVGDKALIDHLDAYTAPRLVEYFDDDPCRRRWVEENMPAAPMRMSAADAEASAQAKSLGVTIEASYTVGEYDILILSARESDGLITWLKANRYRIPDGAEPVVASYLKQGMKFFVAKVNLEEQAKLGTRYLRPLQMAFETPKFMLPIRLGTVNARGAQELFVYTLTRPSAGRGRVETSNYRTVKLPTGQEVPIFVKAEFSDFYRDLFTEQVKREHRQAVFVEYAWNMAWCDPCAADPLSAKELRELGVFWLGDLAPGQPAQDVFVTRLHVRYDRERFPEDLQFQHTGDTSNFQGRYVLRHPWKGTATCPAARDYYRQVAERQRQEAETLASLTGWKLADIHRKIDFVEVPTGGEDPWWKSIWPGR